MLNDFDTENKHLLELIVADARFDLTGTKGISISYESPSRLD